MNGYCIAGLVLLALSLILGCLYYLRATKRDKLDHSAVLSPYATPERLEAYVALRRAEKPPVVRPSFWAGSGKERAKSDGGGSG